MKICYITDTHLGARSGSKVFREYFANYYKNILFPAMKEQNVDCIVHGGDFFDSRNSINLGDIDYIVNEFIPLVNEYKIPIYVIAGNHDTHYKNTNRINSLSLLKSCPLIKIVDEDVYVLETGDRDIVLCPWINVSNEGKLTEEIKSHASKDKILVGHFEINDFKMYKSSILSSGGMDRELFKGFHKVLSGHYHHHSEAGNICYLGSLFYLTWDDHNDWRGYTLYDSSTDRYEQIKNEESLFTELEYKDALQLSDDDLKVLCSNQFVKLYIFDKYERIDLKDLGHRIDKQNPLSFDIVDYTILNETDGSENEVNDDNEIDKGRTIVDYAKEELGEHERKEDILAKFEEMRLTALNNLKDVI